MDIQVTKIVFNKSSYWQYFFANGFRVFRFWRIPTGKLFRSYKTSRPVDALIGGA